MHTYIYIINEVLENIYIHMYIKLKKILRAAPFYRYLLCERHVTSHISALLENNAEIWILKGKGKGKGKGYLGFSFSESLCIYDLRCSPAQIKHN